VKRGLLPADPESLRLNAHVQQTLPNTPSTPLHRPARLGRGGRVGVMLAVLALLLAQSLGLAHRVWHDPGHAHRLIAAAGTPQWNLKAGPDCPEHAHHDGGPFHGHEEGSAECRLLDQLAHADALLAGAAATSVALLPAAPAGLVPGSAEGRHLAAYQARAPPRPAGADPSARRG
jgi:hypothetical protein